MGKKVKKRAARTAQKGKQLPTASPKTVSQEIIIPAANTAVNGVSVVKETQTCPHLDDGIYLEKVSLKISSLESLKCDDCRDSVADRRPKKGKSKHGKVKGNGSKSESTSIWVCLECGHCSCGGVGFPTTPQSHAARHSKQYRHPLVIQFANPNLRWCFPCNTLIPVQSFEKEQKDTLSEIVKLFKTQPSSDTRVDVEDIWFGSGSVTSGIKSTSAVTSCIENGDGYMVRGLVNLGNTCFFNSVLQNLLAMDKVRDHFLKLEGAMGPLTASLKKLFVETGPSTARNIINPRAFFGCVCAKAPQFKGFQQHDSHELLRCLLDGLCTEESRVQKHAQDGKLSPKHTPTFVDLIFGGQISSTVSCLECGHASVVYEPCLDLSLPLPTKNTQSKRAAPVSRSKKPKLPPKRQGKFRAKSKRVANVSMNDESLGPTKPIETCTDINIAPSSDSTQSGNLVQPDCIEQPTTLSNNDNGAVNSSSTSSMLDHGEPVTVTVMNGHDTPVNKVDFVDTEDTSSWLDYLEPGNPTVHDVTSHNQDYGNGNDVVHDVTSHNHDYGNGNDVVWEDELLPKVQESEVLLLPYKEIGSPSEKEPSDFDGFGGLFDEPELADEPSGGLIVNLLSNGNEESESDPDEVDDTDSPVSVEKCLAYFTTPELLTKTEHAWQCEKCSKSLLEQKTRLKNKLKKSIPNRGENGISGVSSDSCVDHVLSNGFRNVSDQITESADLALDSGNSDNGQDTESCSVNGPTDDCNSEKVLESKHESDSSEDEEVDSKGAKVARDASKRILISRAPPILTVHLKRFCQDARGRLSKLNGHVNFRDTIDLKPYMDPSCCKDRETYKYQLVGVVEHSGTMRGGHYVAYVKGKGNSTWYHASDAYVHEASLEQVLGCEAYILFYQEEM